MKSLIMSTKYATGTLAAICVTALGHSTKIRTDSSECTRRALSRHFLLLGIKTQDRHERQAARLTEGLIFILNNRKACAHQNIGHSSRNGASPDCDV